MKEQDRLQSAVSQHSDSAFHEYETRMSKLAFGGLIGISLIIIQAFISSGPLDLSATISVLSFAVAIPLLAMRIIIDDTIDMSKRIKSSVDGESVRWGGLCGATVGMVTAFWHMLWIAGVLFLVSGAFGLIVYLRYHYLLVDEREKEKQ